MHLPSRLRSIGYAIAALPVIGASSPAAPPALPRPLPSLADPETPTHLPIIIEVASRMTVPVEFDGARPLSFLIDTGAERSGIADDVASDLKLADHGRRTVVGFAGTQSVPTVLIPQLRYARSKRLGIEALRFSREAIGADGFLGIDSLDGQMVEFDFVKDRMTIRRASIRGLRPSNDSIIVGAVIRRGRLLFTQSRINRIDVVTMLDTGSSLTVGNAALRDKLAAKGRLGPTIPVQMLSITGKLIDTDYGIAREVMVGNVLIRSLPIAFATTEPFAQLGLSDRPAMLLGMDALSAFGTVAIDFRNASVRFVARGGTGGDTRISLREEGW
jgi:hypothetical protein